MLGGLALPSSMSFVLILILYPCAYPSTVENKRLHDSTICRMSRRSFSDTSSSMCISFMISSVVNSNSHSSRVGSAMNFPTAVSMPTSTSRDPEF